MENMPSPYSEDEEAPSAFQHAPRANSIDHSNDDDDASSYVSKEGSSNKGLLLVAMAICAFLFGGGIVAGIWAFNESAKDDTARTAPAGTSANNAGGSSGGGGATAPTTADPFRPTASPIQNNPTLQFTSKPTNRPTIPAAPSTNNDARPQPTPPPPTLAPQAPPASNQDRLINAHGPLWQDSARWLFQTDFYQTSGYDELAERYALAVLFGRTSGSNLWNFKGGWLSSSSVCSGWYGIACNSAGKVVGIELSDNSLVGSLPTELGILSALTSITILNSFELSGSLPTEVSLLTALRQITIRSNYLTGSIPNQISNLQSLTKLDLENNILSGSIPSSIPALINLQQFSAGGNELNGNIPDGIVDLTNLRTLELDGNKLVGTLPDLSLLRSLEKLVLKTNKLSGRVPVLPSSLQFCDLDWNSWSNTDNGASKGCF